MGKEKFVMKREEKHGKEVKMNRRTISDLLDKMMGISQDKGKDEQIRALEGEGFEDITDHFDGSYSGKKIFINKNNLLIYDTRSRNIVGIYEKAHKFERRPPAYEQLERFGIEQSDGLCLEEHS